MSRFKAERLERLRMLCYVQKHSVKAAARIIGVDERTGYRYAREIEGSIDRRSRRYYELRPLLLAHLQQHPNASFTAGKLARVVNREGGRWCYPSNAATALGRMEREGLVTSVEGIRTDRDYETPQRAIYWSLAQQDDPPTSSYITDPDERAQFVADHAPDYIRPVP